MKCLTDYNRYKSVYEECPKALNISSCPAAQKETVLEYHYFSDFSEYRIATPMPGILPYPNDTDIHGARKIDTGSADTTKSSIPMASFNRLTLTSTLTQTNRA